MNRRMLILLVFLLNLTAWVLIREVNHGLGPLRFYLHVEILLVILPALYLRAVTGFGLAIALGLVVGAGRPLPIELSVAAMLSLWIAGIWMRRRIRREHRGQLAAFAAVAQLALLLVFGLLLWPDQAFVLPDYVQRWLIDALVSATFVALAAPLWSRLQVRLLQGFGWNLDAESELK